MPRSFYIFKTQNQTENNQSRILKNGIKRLEGVGTGTISDPDTLYNNYVIFVISQF